MEVLTKIVIPTSTFILGMLFTYALSRHTRRQLIISQHVDELCKLAAEWYEQIHEMDVALEHDPEDFDEIKKQIYFYVQNRLVLPKYLRSYNVLINCKPNSEFVQSAKSFLMLLTDYHPEMQENMAKGVRCADFLSGRISGIIDKKKTHKKIKSLLPQIDSCLQKMNRSAAVLTR